MYGQTIAIREAVEADTVWIRPFLESRWGDATMVVSDVRVDLMKVPALIAGNNEGLLTYRVVDDEVEILSLDAIVAQKGVGTALVTHLCDSFRELGSKAIIVSTTNDNLDGLRFYQTRGFQITEVRCGAIGKARLIKASIPLTGAYGIPVSDEIKLRRPL
ncbi:GNAT family N-acetyltransferase [Nguyenibacter vanlangensis]|uniref:GNAT family N-acetyltransferase n=1 Tax=Nguyenibacter vanlangensis TaxID=1216886 RepID=A0ABZ3D6I6_9PROT